VRRAWPVLLVATAASAQPPRTFYTLPSSNGHGAVIGDAAQAKVTHFREHLAATEEPQIDDGGVDVWVGNEPQIIKTRDLLDEAYFGVRIAGQQQWLSTVPVTSSGYEDGIVTWSQSTGGVTLTTWIFAPRALPHAGFVMILRIQGAADAAFSLHNFHLGYGRPGVMTTIAANGETLTFDVSHDVLERAFAGVVVARPLGTVTHAFGWNGASAPAQNGYQIVQNGGSTDLGDCSGELAVADDSASAFQFATPGTDTTLGVVFVHSGDPLAGPTVQGWLDTYVAGRSAQQVLDDERAAWASALAGLQLPAGLTDDQQKVARQSAVMLTMAQVQESQTFLRELLTNDSEPRYSRFGAPLPATVQHDGRGAILAGLPPGESTYAWVRDQSYATVALASVGLKTQATDALDFLLHAQAGRFQSWHELEPYNLPPYAISLVRYTGFGVEETDENDFGPNFEFDGFGLTLWAIRQVNDAAFIDASWDTIATRIADPLVALIDPATGLLRPDSSIWETHWNGHQRTWTFSNLTAVRGLCDAAELADARGDPRGTAWRNAALALRAAIASKLTDSNGALASNLEELQSGSGYADAAVIEAFALGIFAPDRRIGRATLALLDQQLKAHAGPGWSRNDDVVDHPTGVDLSPWGSAYDSAEWVFTDLRGALLAPTLDWTTAQAAANAGVIPETYDENSGAWKFNAPMVGFGAGVYLLALRPPIAPACGAYFDEPVPDAGSGLDAGAADGGASDAGVETVPPSKRCGCDTGPSAASVVVLASALRRWLRRPSSPRSDR
jgi:hypothetical protein